MIRAYPNEILENKEGKIVERYYIYVQDDKTLLYLLIGTIALVAIVGLVVIVALK
jgi:hypothetical protein